MSAMSRLARRFAPLLLPAFMATAATVPVNLDDYREGPVKVSATDAEVEVQWQDEAGRDWTVSFRRDPSKPLIASLSVGENLILRDGRPYYRVETGIRRKGWNAFFDYPPEHPQGTAAFFGTLDLEGLRVETAGNRVRIHCGGFRAGPFAGSVSYTFFAGSRLIQQAADVSTNDRDVAFFYDAGIEFMAPEQLLPGRNMDTPYAYYDTQGQLRRQSANGFQPERVPHKVRYRAMATAAGQGSIAAFPAPHQFFFPRDFTSNLSHNWHRSWRGMVALGIRQVRDANWRFYPWMNAPPGSQQALSLFLLAGDGPPEAVLEDALRYTHRDRFPALDGYKTRGCALPPGLHDSSSRGGQGLGPTLQAGTAEHGSQRRDHHGFPR